MIPSLYVELVSFLKDILIGLSALTAAIIGIIGLRQWRAELKGKTKFETARKLALLSFEFRDKFKSARAPLTFASESAQRQKGDNETPEEAQLLDEYFAREKRLKPLQETLKKLNIANWEAEIILNENNLIQSLNDAFITLLASTHTYFDTKIKQVRSPLRGPVQEEAWLQSHHKIIYGIEDEFSQSIDDAVNTLTQKLRRYIK